MIAQLLNRGFVLDQLETLIADLERGGRPEERAGGRAGAELEPSALDEALEELRGARDREEAASSGQPSFDPPPPERRSEQIPPLDDFAFLSRDPVISLVQSALEQYFLEREPEALVEAAPTDDRRAAGEEVAVTEWSLEGVAAEPQRVEGRRRFGPFEPRDVRWANTLVAMGVRRLKGRRKFNPEPAPDVTIADRARLVLVGDWGTGVERARKVGAQMRAVLDQGRAEGLDQHAIHLGDVYYSGWQNEYERRVLPHWPVRPQDAATTGSWALNGNHDMYSGGHAYFDYLLGDPRFTAQSRSSFFALKNAHWQILGLDTAYDDHALQDPQGEWVEQRAGDSAGAKTVLLSHHQLFSAYEDGGPKLAAKLAGPLGDGAVYAWFWGHEHRCALYAPHEGVTYARCVGHGGVPVYMGHGENDPYPPPALYEYRGSYTKGRERWARMGFAVLDFDGPSLHVRYIDENGAEHFAEDIV